MTFRSNIELGFITVLLIIAWQLSEIRRDLKKWKGIKLYRS